MRHFHVSLRQPDRWEPLQNSALDLAPPLDREILLEGGDVRLFPELEPEFSFHEALPSWNVDLDEGMGFVVEVRVATAVRGGWSPWMRIGSFGSEIPVEHGDFGWPDGSVEVDILCSAVKQSRYQQRLCAFGRGGCVVARRMTVCLTDRSRASAAGPSSIQPVPRIPVPFRSQQSEEGAIRSRICSPTSVAMVLEYRGITCSTIEVAWRLFDAAHDTYGNWSRAVQGAHTFGVPGLVVRFSAWSEVESVLRRGQPLIVSIGVGEGRLTGAPYRSTAGHLLVLAGLDD
ncbi:MAG: C39 family peptidase, partial [Planctomycetota bacterium]